MELVLFGNSINIFNLVLMVFLYIFTISIALCGTVTVDNIKSIITFLFRDIIQEKEDNKEGFTSISKNCPCKNKKSQCNKFSQNNCIDENPLHELNDINAYELEPASYNNSFN